MSIEIRMTEYPTAEDWMEVKRRALVTVGMIPKEGPTEKWKDDILNARHSPIRRLRFSFDIYNIPYYVSVHLARHVHAQPYIKSQRNDRQNEYDRNAARQDSLVSMIWDLNGEEMMIVFNKRLCNKADSKTRKVIEMLRDIVVSECPEFAKHAVKMCDYLGRCPEMKSCKEGE